MDEPTYRYVAALAAEFATLFEDELVGVYLHGSAVLGGYNPSKSDIDILVVVTNATLVDFTATANRIKKIQPCPATGLELSIVTQQAAAHPTAKPKFLLHITTAPHDSKAIDGTNHEGDPDLVLHFAVCNTHGRLVGDGRAAREVFGLDNILVKAQLLEELSWGTENAEGEYAVLNACRAWRYFEDGSLVSKVEGGRWALEIVSWREREVVKEAMERQVGGKRDQLDHGAVMAFVDGVLKRVVGK